MGLGERAVIELFNLDARGRIADVEGTRLEFKANIGDSATEKAEAMETIIAFSNGSGGQLVIGVANDGSIIGVDDPLREEERLVNLVSDTIRPQVVPKVDLVTIGNKTVLVAEVFPGSQRPYHLKAKGPRQGTYIRVGSSDRVAGPGTLIDLEHDGLGTPYDRKRAVRAKMGDLDLARLGEMYGRDFDENTLHTLDFVVEDQGELVPTNAGMLIGSPHPERSMPHAFVMCARFRGNEKIVFVDKADIYGPLPAAIDEILSFLKRNAFLRSEIGEVRRKDVYSIPLRALREVIVNALVHASYAYHGTPIRVAFFDDSITVESPGGLMVGQTIDGMLAGRSEIRNPTLARAFRELNLIEQWGTGMSTAAEELRELGLPPLSVEDTGDRLIVTVPIENHDPESRTVMRDRAGNLDTRTRTSGAEASVEGVDACVEVGYRSVEVLRAAETSPQSRAELLAALGMTGHPANVKRHITPLVEAGLLALTHPDAPRSPKQRYRITKAGLAWLANANLSADEEL